MAKVKSLELEESQWADPYAFKNMKEALKFTMGFNDNLVSSLEKQIKGLEES